VVASLQVRGLARLLESLLDRLRRLLLLALEEEDALGGGVDPLGGRWRRSLRAGLGD